MLLLPVDTNAVHLFIHKILAKPREHLQHELTDPDDVQCGAAHREGFRVSSGGAGIVVAEVGVLSSATTTGALASSLTSDADDCRWASAAETLPLARASPLACSWLSD